MEREKITLSRTLDLRPVLWRARKPVATYLALSVLFVVLSVSVRAMDAAADILLYGLVLVLVGLLLYLLDGTIQFFLRRYIVDCDGIRPTFTLGTYRLRWEDITALGIYTDGSQHKHTFFCTTSPKKIISTARSYLVSHDQADELLPSNKDVLADVEQWHFALKLYLSIDAGRRDSGGSSQVIWVPYHPAHTEEIAVFWHGPQLEL